MTTLADIAAHAHVSEATVSRVLNGIGAAAVCALTEAIAGAPVPNREYVHRPELVLRGSTGPVRPDR